MDPRKRLHYSILALCGLGALAVLIPARVSYRGDMKVEKIVVGPLQVNCFVLWDEANREAMVIDPGDDAADILKVIRDNALIVRYIINTHAHFDHVGANKAVKDATGAEILIHEADNVLLGAASDQARMFGMTTPSSPKADRFVKHGDVLTAGSVSLTVLHTPGHSGGGISLLGNGMVFTGDALFAGSIGRTDLFGGDLTMLITAIKAHLMTLPDDTKVLAGHGPISTIGAERRENPFLHPGSGF